jgi:polysaccharide biosynthesis/export protein
MRRITATRLEDAPRAPSRRIGAALSSRRLWLAAPALLLLAAGWCSLHISQFDLLRKTPILDTDDAKEREKERNKPKKFRLGGENEVATRPVDPNFQLCQASAPAGPAPGCVVDCGFGGACGQGGSGILPVQFQTYGPGEYVGHARLAHVPAYRLRVDDQLECLYRLTREETSEPYEINVGDELQLESVSDEKLNRSLIVQPDGTITVKLLGQVKATGNTVAELRDKLETLYGKFYPNGAAITVTPLKVNTRLEDLRATVDSRYGDAGGQGVRVRITPEGTISLPAIGTVPAQGLTLEELKVEIDLRYAATISGIEVTPILAQRAPRFCYVLGEVRVPNRYVLEGPTTVMQAIALAGSWNVGANLRQVVIFRRGEDWRLLATTVDLQGALLYANQPCPAGEIWLNDSDVIILPKGKILLGDDFIHLVFTRGVYGILPFGASYSWSAASIR